MEAEKREAIERLSRQLGDGKEPPMSPISWVFVAVLTVAAFATRFYNIRSGNFVLYPPCGPGC